MAHQSMQQQMLQEMMLAFYGQLRQTVPVTLLAVLLFSVTMYPQHPTEALGWLFYMLVHTVIRGFSVRDYFRVRDLRSAEHWFMREFWFTLTLSVGWCAFTMLFFHPETTELFYIMLLYIVAAVSGSLITYAASPVLYGMLVGICFVPLTVQLATTASLYPNHVYLATGFCLYMGVLMRYHHQAHRTLRRATELYLNQNLLMEEMHRSKERLHKSHQQLQESNSQLEVALRHSHQLAAHDALTGCYNRRTFLEHLFRHASSGVSQPLTVLMLDLDHFKKINDQHGHLFGDHVLKVVSARIHQALRTEDVLARYGGEEFICLLPCTSLEEGRAIAETIRRAIAGTPVRNDHISHHLTVSIGITTHSLHEEPMQLVKRADQALYQAKEGGRDCVVLA